MQTPPRHGDPLRVERSVQDSVVIVTAAGDVDMDTAPILLEELIFAVAQATPPAPVIVDLRDIEFFGSSGIAALLDAHQRCTQRDITLRVVATPIVTKPLAITGALPTVVIYTTLADALRG